MSFQARPISFKPMWLSGLSARLIASHYENNYGGAVRRLNVALARWRERQRTRRQLSILDDRQLADVGLTRTQQRVECAKWF